MLKALSVVSLLLAPVALAQKTLKVELKAQERPEPTQISYVSDGATPFLQANQIELDLGNKRDTLFSGKFFFGSQKAEANLTLDSGSDWVFVMTPDCEICNPDKRVYDPKKSTTANPATNLPYIAMYGPLYVVGDDYNDTVCISYSKQCVDNFRFLAVTDMDPKMTQMQGLLGLAPDDPSNGPSYVAALWSASMIDKKQFGMIFGKDNTPSELTLGGFDQSYLPNDQQLHKYFIQNKTRWEIDIQDFKIDNTSLWSSSRKAVIDSFFRPLALPPDEFANFKVYIESNYPFVSCDLNKGTCQFLGQCKTKSAQFKPVRVQFGDRFTYSVQPTDYLFEKTFADGTTVCGFEIQKNNADYFIIGQSFLFNFYTGYDLEENSITFYLHNYSNSDVKYDGIERQLPQVDEPDRSKFPIWVIILIVVIVVGGLLAGAVIIMLKRRKARLAQNLEEYNQLEGTRGGNKTKTLE